MQHGNVTIPQFPPSNKMQISDHARCLGVEMEPGAADHRWTKARNKSVGVCARIRSSSRCQVQRLVSFKSFALSVLTFIGSVAEPYKAAIAAENVALQKLSAGPLHTLPAALLRRRSTCGLNIDVDCIQVTSKAARFRVASRSDVLSAGMAHIRAAKGHGGRTALGVWTTCISAPRLLPLTPPLFSDGQRHG